MSAQTLETLSQRVIELAANQVEMPADQVSLDSNFAADLGYDSLDYVEFSMMVEEEFDIIVPDEEIDNIKTVGDAFKLIQKSIT